MMALNLDYFYGNEAGQFTFYRVPKILFTGDEYRDLSLEAKVLYGLLLDRVGLSAKNGWLDEAGRVFIYFTQEDAAELIACGKDKAIRLFRELEDMGLILRRKQGLGRPARIFVKNFVPCDAAQTAESDVKTSEKMTSRPLKSRSQDLGFSDSNKTEQKENKKSDTDLSSPSAPPTERRRRERRKIGMDEMDRIRETIQENIDYEGLILDKPYDRDLIDGYVDLMTEACCSSRDAVRICGNDVPAAAARSRFLRLTREHIGYVRDCLSSTTAAIGNIKAYTLAALYNAPATMDQYYAALVSRDLAEPGPNFPPAASRTA